WIDGLQKAALRVAQVGDGIEGYLGDGLSEDHVEDQQVVQRNVRQALCAGRLSRGVQEKATAGECQVEAGISRGEGPGGRVAQDLVEAEVLEEVAAVGLAHALTPSSGPPAPAPVRQSPLPGRPCGGPLPRGGSRSACRPARRPLAPPRARPRGPR